MNCDPDLILSFLSGGVLGAELSYLVCIVRGNNNLMKVNPMQ